MCLLQSLFQQQTYPTATCTIKDQQWNIIHKQQQIHLDEKMLCLEPRRGLHL
jgi:hypothetical protein